MHRECMSHTRTYYLHHKANLDVIKQAKLQVEVHRAFLVPVHKFMRSLRNVIRSLKKLWGRSETLWGRSEILWGRQVDQKSYEVARIYHEFAQNCYEVTRLYQEVGWQFYESAAISKPAYKVAKPDYYAEQA